MTSHPEPRNNTGQGPRRPPWRRRDLLAALGVGVGTGLGAGLALPARPAEAALLPARGYDFRVLREGREIGRHRVRQDADGVVRSLITIEVKLLSFTVFRLRQEYAERWQDGRLVSYAASSLRNGEETRMDLALSGGRLRGTGPEGAVDLPGASAPLSWWSTAHFGHRLFDTTTGEALQGMAQREDAGTLIRWRWPPRGAVGVYEPSGRWVGFSIRGDDGSEVRYEPA